LLTKKDTGGSFGLKPGTLTPFIIFDTDNKPYNIDIKDDGWELKALEIVDNVNTALWHYKDGADEAYETYEYDEKWREEYYGDELTQEEVERFGIDASSLQKSFTLDASGDYIIKGDDEKNKLKGTNESDKIFGFKGSDKIDGKKGDDIIDPGVYDKGRYDTVKGGKGSDTFVLKDGYWAYIKDFKVVQDSLDLNGLSGYVSWDIVKNMTYIYGDDDFEVARIKGRHDLDLATYV
jgi:Ca2+-binding RTX toxin-like protein